MSFLNDTLGALKQLALIEHRLDALSEETKRQAEEMRSLDRRVTRLEAFDEVRGASPGAPPLLIPEETNE